MTLDDAALVLVEENETPSFEERHATFKRAIHAISDDISFNGVDYEESRAFMRLLHETPNVRTLDYDQYNEHR